MTTAEISSGHHFREYLAGALLLIALLFTALPLAAQDAVVNGYRAAEIPMDVDLIYREFEPEEGAGDTTRNIMYQMVRNHFSNIVFDDEFSSTMLDRYITALDPSRIHFKAEDTEHFERYRYQLDDLLRSGDLDAGYEIYNIYHRRLIERLVYSVMQVESDDLELFDFTIDESMTVDRSEASWASDRTELEELWRQRVKSAVLRRMLAGDTLEEALEGQSQNYRSQLNQVLRRNSRDVFQVYMDSMTTSFDPHTQYYAPRDAENFNMNMSLSLEGIGAVLTTRDEYTEVVSIVTGGPADMNGELQPTDRISGVAQGEDGEFVNILGWRVDDVVQLIRGEKGSLVRLRVIPADNELETRVISITRDRVNLEDQSAQKEIVEIRQDDVNYKIGVVRLPTFYVDFEALQRRDPNYRSSTRDVRRLLEELKAEGVDGVVVDLRNNGGGSLSEANSLVGLFITRGATVQIKDADGNTIVQGDSNPEVAYDGPLAILVNSLSASASEIVAGAIQDYQRGLVLGSPTYGKGTVQQLIPMGQGQIKLTQAKFYRISGESTQSRGVIPDIEFPDLFAAANEVGESVLPTALPWDTIEPNFYRPYGDLQPVIPLLRSRHAQRLETDPEFNYIQAQIERAVRNRENNELSLNKEVLLAEREESNRWRLDLENQLRAARGQPLFEDVEEMESNDNAQVRNRPGTQAEREDGETDPYLRESGNILIDLINMSEAENFNLNIANRLGRN